MATTEEIQKITDAIVQTVNPMKVYLFGSYVTGEATPKSDLDFLVIMPDHTKKKYEVAGMIEKSTRELSHITKDLIIDYADKYERFASVPYSFIGHIVKTGKLLYAS